MPARGDEREYFSSTEQRSTAARLAEIQRCRPQAMDVKTLFGLTVIPAAFLGGIVLACFFTRVRDLFFVMLVSLSPLIERLDIIT